MQKPHVWLLAKLSHWQGNCRHKWKQAAHTPLSLRHGMELTVLTSENTRRLVGEADLMSRSWPGFNLPSLSLSPFLSLHISVLHSFCLSSHVHLILAERVMFILALCLMLKIQLLFIEKHTTVRCLPFMSQESAFVYSGYLRVWTRLDRDTASACLILHSALPHFVQILTKQSTICSAFIATILWL